MQYDAIVRIFVLPKTNTPHTLIVISLDPPIRKGQTHYPHILIQFPSDEETSTDLSISDEVFEAKNEAVSPHGLSKEPAFLKAEAQSPREVCRSFMALPNSCVTASARCVCMFAVWWQAEQALGRASV